MNTDLLPALHLALGALLANLPWCARRWKFMARLGLALGGYALWVGGAQLALRGAGHAPVTAWELWPVTLALFAVAGFPGIVWRYLR